MSIPRETVRSMRYTLNASRIAFIHARRLSIVSAQKRYTLSSNAFGFLSKKWNPLLSSTALQSVYRDRSTIPAGVHDPSSLK